MKNTRNVTPYSSIRWHFIVRSPRYIVGTIKCRKRHFMVLFICNNNIALVPKLKNPSTLFLSLDRPKSWCPSFSEGTHLPRRFCLPGFPKGREVSEDDGAGVQGSLSFRCHFSRIMYSSSWNVLFSESSSASTTSLLWGGREHEENCPVRANVGTAREGAFVTNSSCSNAAQPEAYHREVSKNKGRYFRRIDNLDDHPWSS